MSNSVRPQRQQPTRSHAPAHPIPGILQARTLERGAIAFSKHESEKWEWRCSVVSNSSWPHGLQPTRLLCPWDSPGKTTGVGCHCLLLLLKHPPSTTYYVEDKSRRELWIMLRDICEIFILPTARTDINYFHGTNGSHKVKKVYSELACTNLSQGPRMFCYF